MFDCDERGVMTFPDMDGAKRYVFARLERELPSTLYYHSLAHTRDDVLPAATRLARLEGLSGEDQLLLETAAIYHDVGFVERYRDHEDLGAEIAAQSLPCFGYNADQIRRICAVILATVVTTVPRNLLEAVIKDADLDVLGRKDFCASNHRLLQESRLYVGPVEEGVWVAGQAQFLVEHTYFTRSAQALRDAGKRRNLARLRAQLDLLREGASE